MTLQFIDTNVLLYAYDADAGPRHERALGLVAELGRERTAAISIQVLQEFYVNATRKIAVPLSVEAAQARLRVLSRWSVHSPLTSDVIAASAIAEASQLSFWDAMIVRSAERLGCGVIWSEDLNAGQLVAGVRIRNPFRD